MRNATEYSKDRLQFWAGQLHGDDGLTDLFEVESGRVSLNAREFFEFLLSTGFGRGRGFNAATASARFGDWRQKNSRFASKRWHSTAFNHLLNELTFVGVFDRIWTGSHFEYTLRTEVKKNGLNWIYSSSFLFGGGLGLACDDDE